MHPRQLDQPHQLGVRVQHDAEHGPLSSAADLGSTAGSAATFATATVPTAALTTASLTTATLATTALATTALATTALATS